SGSERPAWRMNQTGVRSTGSHRQALTSRDFDTSVSLAFGDTVTRRQLPAATEANGPAAAGAGAEDTELEGGVGRGEFRRVTVRDGHGDGEAALAHWQTGEVQQ